MAGANTSTAPATAPGRARGQITRRNTAIRVAYKSWAASMSRGSILSRVE